MCRQRPASNVSLVNKTELLYKSYNNESVVYERNFLSGSGPSSESSPSSRQVGMLYAELGSSNPGSMGIANDHRFSNRIPQGTIPKQAPKQPQYFLKRAGVNRYGGRVYVVQRGSQEIPPFRESGRVLLNPISSTQKGWGYKTSHQPEETQQIHPPQHFKMEGIIP